MENRNVIETVVHTALTKRELSDLINKSFLMKRLVITDR